MAQAITARLDSERVRIEQQWRDSAPINHFVVDDVLPEASALRIREAFPSGASMVLKRSLRELKYVSAQMDRHDPVLEESIYAFQMPGVVERVQQITQLRALEPDSLLYAGGISLMGPGHFLNPHVDNSHDKHRSRYRVLNLLYYVSPGWGAADGANLELWPQGPRGRPSTIESRFNRLVVMVTHQHSWHSVSRNITDRDRCCVSNYYFSEYPVGDADYFHVTSFRGRPEQPVRDLILRADIWLRMAIRSVFPQGIKENRHFYDKARSGRAPR
jgi:Rps23 Pro-64 3,4-dihydroxylase Tpa1-like proline 4-hydroxylase